MHESLLASTRKECIKYIMQFIPSLKILGNYWISKDVAEWPVIKERWANSSERVNQLTTKYIMH